MGASFALKQSAAYVPFGQGVIWLGPGGWRSRSSLATATTGICHSDSRHLGRSCVTWLSPCVWSATRKISSVGTGGTWTTVCRPWAPSQRSSGSPAQACGLQYGQWSAQMPGMARKLSRFFCYTMPLHPDSSRYSTNVTRNWPRGYRWEGIWLRHSLRLLCKLLVISFDPLHHSITHSQFKAEVDGQQLK